MGYGIDGGHMPRAGLYAGAAANALIRIHTANAVFIGIDCLHGASIAAGGIFALTAGVREIGPVVFCIQTLTIAAAIQIPGDLDS